MSARPLTLALLLSAALAPGCASFSPFRDAKRRSEVVVAAWAEPPRLPPGGGQVHIMVRIRRPNGEPYPGVQVRLQTSEGKLFSGGKTLVTDASGMTRDRLTARRAAEIVVLAGDTRHRFRVPLMTSS